MARSDIERAADRYRRSIEARERAAIRSTLRAYRLALDAANNRLLQLQIGLERQPEKEWRRYAIDQQKALAASLQAELDTAARTSAKVIDTQRAGAFVEASDATRTAVVDSLQSAGHNAFAAALGGNVNQPSLQAVLAQVQQRSAVLNMLQGHAKKGAKAAADRLVTAVALGENPRKIAGAIRADLNTEAWKALRIARTEVIRAHTAGAIGQMRQTPTITPSYEWNARSASACIACLANHGNIYPIGTTPARHPNCKCVMLPVVIDPTTGKPLSQPLETGQDVIDRMPMSEATERFGKRRAELLKSPDTRNVPVSEMVKLRPSEVWGDSVAIVPLDELAV